MKCGRAQVAKGGGNKKRFRYCTVLQEKFFTSELFKVIQDAVSLILLYRTMLLFRAASSNTFITSDVQSIYIPSSIRDWYLEVKIWATDRQYSFCLWIPETKTRRILIRSTWMNRKKQRRNIRIRYIGSILLWRRDWSSIKHNRTLSFFTKHSQLIVFRKLFGWKLEKSYTRKYMRHLVLLPPWNMIGWKNWVQKLLNNHMDKLFNNVKVPNQTNQIQTQIMIERRNPLFALKEEQENRPVPRRSKTRSFHEEVVKHDRTVKPVVCRDASHAQGASQTRSSHESTNFNVEAENKSCQNGGNPLFSVTQGTRKVTSDQCWTRWTLTS